MKRLLTIAGAAAVVTLAGCGGSGDEIVVPDLGVPGMSMGVKYNCTTKEVLRIKGENEEMLSSSLSFLTPGEWYDFDSFSARMRQEEGNDLVSPKESWDSVVSLVKCSS